jgi:hypothetical protein
MSSVGVERSLRKLLTTMNLKLYHERRIWWKTVVILKMVRCSLEKEKTACKLPEAFVIPQATNTLLSGFHHYTMYNIPGVADLKVKKYLVKWESSRQPVRHG